MKHSYRLFYAVAALCINSATFASETSKSTGTESSSNTKSVRIRNKPLISNGVSTLLAAIEKKSVGAVKCEQDTQGLSYFCQLSEHHIVSSIKTTTHTGNLPFIECTALETYYNPATKKHKHVAYKDGQALLIHQQLALISLSNIVVPISPSK